MLLVSVDDGCDFLREKVMGTSKGGWGEREATKSETHHANWWESWTVFGRREALPGQDRPRPFLFGVKGGKMEEVWPLNALYVPF